MDFYKKILMTMLRKCGERDDLLMGFAFLCLFLCNSHSTIYVKKLPQWSNDSLYRCYFNGKNLV